MEIDLWYTSSSKTLVHYLTKTSHNITHAVGWLLNITITTLYNIGINEHTQ